MSVRPIDPQRLLRLARWVLCFAMVSSHSHASLEGNLVSQSPFLPPGWGAKPEAKPVVEAPVTQGPLGRELEFRGIFEMGGVTRFSIFDKSTQKGQWYTVDGGNDRFSIIRFDEQNDRIIIKAGGGTEELRLAAADDKPIPVAGAMPAGLKPPGPPPNFIPGAPPSGVPSTSPPTTIPPPPPAALLNARNGNTNDSGGVQRRRIIRRSDDSSSETSGNGQQPTGNNWTPPSHTPGAPPTGVPSTPPPTGAPSTPPPSR